MFAEILNGEEEVASGIVPICMYSEIKFSRRPCDAKIRDLSRKVNLEICRVMREKISYIPKNIAILYVVY